MIEIQEKKEVMTEEKMRFEAEVSRLLDLKRIRCV